MKKKILFVAACITGSSLFAQDTTLQKDSAKVMEDVLITVTKFLQKQNETGKVVTVITKEQLQQNSGKTLPEVLNQQAGITISGANNNFGTNQSLFIRGAHAANTLILVDGVPLYDASGETMQFDISNLSLYNIERIEIMKGAQSTLYGSDAVAGVINIVTRKSGDKQVNLDLLLSGGSYGTNKGFVSLAGRGKNAQSWFISYTALNSDGFSAAYDSTGKKDFDKDGFNQQAYRAHYGFRPFNKADLKLYANYNRNKADIDAGAFTDDKDYTYRYNTTQVGTSFQYQLERTKLHFNYNYNLYKRFYKDDSSSVGGFAKYQEGRYTGYSHFAELYSDSKITENTSLIGGIDFRQNSTDQSYFSISSFGPFRSMPLGKDSVKTTQVSAYAMIAAKFKKGFHAEAGGRWNNHSLYGNNFTWSLNPYLVTGAAKFFANISTGYRVPSLYQLYSEYGNRKLKPESSTTYEAGVKYAKDVIDARIVAFYRNIKNVFFFYTNPVTFAGMYINEDRQKDHGAEAEVTLNVSDNVKLLANYSWVKGKLSTKDFSGKDTVYSNLFRKPMSTFNLTAKYRPSRLLMFSAHFKTVSHSYEARYAAPPVKMKGYYTIDLYGEFGGNQGCKYFIDAQNITNQKYFDIMGFNSKRFNINAGLYFRIWGFKGRTCEGCR